MDTQNKGGASMKDSSLGSFLQQLRKENQLTQKELASQLHVTDKAVSKWERDLSAPDISLLIPLAQILGVSTTDGRSTPSGD